LDKRNRFCPAVIRDRGVLNSDPSMDDTDGAAAIDITIGITGMVAADGRIREECSSGIVANAIVIVDGRPSLKT
jgi:hypothetical protein